MRRGDNDPTFRANREARLAAMAARRQSPEWEAAGQQLVSARQNAAAARQESLAAARRAEQQRRRDEQPVTDVELRRAVDQCEAAIADAAADTGYEPDVIAYDIIIGQCLNFRTKLAEEVKRVTLGILPDEEHDVETIIEQLIRGE